MANIIQLAGQLKQSAGGMMRRGFLLVVLLFVLSPSIYAASVSAGSLRAGVSNSRGDRRLNASQLRKTIDSLREKTGFLEMRFDQSGLLVLGDRARFAGGSAIARELLITAVDGRWAVELEAHNHSADVAFACIKTQAIYLSFTTKARTESFLVSLDFADFDELRGEPEVRASFDLGFVFLHELAHAVLNLTDAIGETKTLGECDELINRIRRDLRLPERIGYSPLIQAEIPRPAGTIRLAELIFIRERQESNRTKVERFYLQWEAKRVANAVSRRTAIAVAR